MAVMTLARAWRRHLSGGLAGAAVVPAVLLVALFAFAFAGGLAPIGVLSQALSGPAAPASAPSAALTRAAHPLPPAALAALSAATTPTVTIVGRARLVGRGTAPATRHTVTAPRVGVVRTVGRPTGGTTPTGGASGGGQSPPPRHPTVIDQIVGAGTAVTSQLPGPAGPLATATLEAAGSTADQILPPGSQTLP